ncbi:hypothetical protein Hanom_Chr07g00657881 [Helianthus anomalus]
MQNYYRAGVSPEATYLFLTGRGKAVYILPSPDPTLALLLVGFNTRLVYAYMRRISGFKRSKWV